MIEVLEVLISLLVLAFIIQPICLFVMAIPVWIGWLILQLIGYVEGLIRS